MSANNLENLVKTAMEKIREMVDCQTIIGNPITVNETTTIIPVSKVSCGFASGGSDLPTSSSKDCFGGGSGAGITISPIAFIAVTNEEVKLLQLSMNAPKENAAIAMLPEIIDKVTAYLNKKKEEKTEE
ncbi:MAG: GerW family sporulation protein [Oscillospiraceae bacterium]|nr:GerW family sporulation protein [Oscillospiraceae bacterium]